MELPSAGKQSRVLIVEDSQATSAFRTKPDVVHTMVDRGIAKFTGKATPAEAWRSLVSTGDVVGIKIYSLPGPNSGTRPSW
jgi:hypothetical protein